MLNYGVRGTTIRLLAVAGAFAVATLTSAGTSSAAPGAAAGVVALTDTGVVHLQSAGSAPRQAPWQASAPMDTPGERHVVPGMEMDKPADAPKAPAGKPADAHEHGATGSPTHPTSHEVPGMEIDKPAGAPAHGDAGGHSATVSPTKAPTSGDMPGMDMPADSSQHGDAAEGDAGGHGDAAEGDAGGHGDAAEGDAGGHGDATEPATEKPLLPVLGTFGGGTAAVMVTAGMMRRKDRERLKVRQAARAARRSAT